MALKFNEAFDKLMEKIPQFDSPTPTIISKDTEEIVQKIVQAFHDINSIFQGTLIDLIKTSINHPYHYPVLFLKMPFNINRIKVLQDKDASVYDLKADVQHPVVRSGYVIPYLIISLFNDDLKRALARIGQMNCTSSKTYTLSVFMTENSAKGMPVFEIKTTGIECEVTLCKFSLKFQFLNDSITYFATGPHFWALDQTTLENSNEAIIKMLSLLLDLHGNQTQVHDAIFLATSTSTPAPESAIEIFLEVLKHLISETDNPERLAFVYNKLMHFKQTDSVDLAELMALFGLNVPDNH